MSQGLQRTEQALARARNRAVLPVLALGLASHSAEIRSSAIRATLRRTDIESHTQLIRLFHCLTDADRRTLCETHHSMPHHAAAALKLALQEGDVLACRNACDFILLCDDYDLFPTLVRVCEKPGHQHAGRTAATMLQMAGALHEALLIWLQGKRTGRDPSFARHQALITLEQSLKRRVRRHRTEIIEAFLLLAPTDSLALASMTGDTSHPCHDQLVLSLSTNVSRGGMERFVALLRDTDAPMPVLLAIGRRTDAAFIEFLLHALKQPLSLRVRRNMQKLRSVVWLENHPEKLLDFDGRSQAMAVELCMASGIGRSAQFALLQAILQGGLPEGRRAAAHALSAFRTQDANELISHAVRDTDSGVKAAALRQLRQKRLPDALPTLVSNLTAASAEVRDAARSSLAEFNFVRYRAMFDILDEQTVRNTGVLVRQVDPKARDLLMEDLNSPSASVRIRAIEMAVAMEAIDDVREPLISLVAHENASVSIEAIVALIDAEGDDVVAALERASAHSNRSITEAALASLSQIRSRADGAMFRAKAGETSEGGT